MEDEGWDVSERGKYVQNIIYHYARREREREHGKWNFNIDRHTDQRNGSTDRQTDMRALREISLLISTNLNCFLPNPLNGNK